MAGKPTSIPNKRSSHHITLNGGGESWGIILENAEQGFIEIPSSPSSMLLSGGGQRYGDGDPNFDQDEQRTWEGGRGLEFYMDDPTRFFDASAWTMTPNVLLPALKWKFPYGIKQQLLYQSSNLSWLPLLSTNRYVADSDAVSTTFTAAIINLWIRCVGSPGTLTVELCANSAGAPSTVLQTATITSANFTDVLSQWYKFVITPQSVTATTTYFVKVYGASTDNIASHWEVGIDKNVSGGLISTAGSSWSAGSFSLHYRVIPASLDRKIIPFIHRGLLFAYSQYADATSSELFLCGDVGKATAAASSTLTDSSKTLVADYAAGGWIRIIAGKGVGQRRQITTNSTTEYTVSVPWSITPDTTSVYGVYGVNYWQTVGSTGLGKVLNVCVANNIVFFAQGADVNIRKMQINASTGALNFGDDNVNRADLMYLFYHPTDKAQVYRVLNGTTVEASRSSLKAWGTGATNPLVFGTGIPIGDPTVPVTSMFDWNNYLYFGKEDGLWLLQNDVAGRINIGMNALPSEYNCAATANYNMQLLFSFLHSVEQMTGGSVDDYGPYNEAGIPIDRSGPIVSIEPVIKWAFHAIDAGTSGTSCVLCWTGRGWHEVFRAPYAGARCQILKWEPISGDRSRLWIGCDGELYYIEFPKDHFNPLRDTSIEYMHESYVTSSTIDGRATDMSKFYKELILISKGLGEGVDIAVDYQCDSDVGTDTWYSKQPVYFSPKGYAPIWESDRKLFRYRLRLNTESGTVPAQVTTVLVKYFTSVPIVRQWNVTAKVSDIQRTLTYQKDGDPTSFYNWLRDVTQKAIGVEMTTMFETVPYTIVKIEPPNWYRTFTNATRKIWGGTVTFTLRELI